MFSRILLLNLFLAFTFSAFSQVGELKQKLDTASEKYQTQILRDLCWTYRFTNADSAFYFGKKAIAKAQKLKDRAGYAGALNDLSIIYIVTSDFDAADSLLQLALQIETELNNQDRIGAILNKLGIISQKKGEIQAALDYNLKALEIYTQLKDLRSQAMITNNIAILHNNLAQYERAREYLRSAYKLKLEIKDSSEAGGTLVNLGNAFLGEKRNDSAKHYFFNALEILLNCNGSEEYIAGSYSSLGHVFKAEGQFEEAIENYNKALSFRRKAQDQHALALTFGHIADVYLLQKMPDKAKPFLDSTNSISKEIDAKLELAENYKSFSEYYRQKGNADSAHAYYERAYQLREIILGEESRNAVAEMETRFETEKKEKEIAELNEDKAEAELAMARQRFWIIALLAIAIIIVLSAFFLNYRRKQRAEARLAEQELSFRKELLDRTVLAQEEERQRIAKDLHDGLVQSLAALKLGIQNGLKKVSLKADAEPIFSEHIRQLDEAANEARGISHQMMPRALTESGLVRAMDDMLNKTLGNTEIEYHFEHFGVEEERLKQSIEVSVYRIAQELVNNVIKHSQASHVEIQLLKNKNHLILHVEDDGAGFELSDKQKQSGIGLSNIFSRASAVNGEVNYEKGEPKGTIANVRVPLA